MEIIKGIVTNIWSTGFSVDLQKKEAEIILLHFYIITIDHTRPFVYSKHTIEWGVITLSIYLSIFICFILAYAVTKITKSHKRQEHCVSDTLICQTVDEHKSLPRHNSILGFCIFSSIFWIIGLSLLYSGYKHIKDSREITEQGNKTIATITNVHKYEVYKHTATLKLPEGSLEKTKAELYFSDYCSNYLTFFNRCLVYNNGKDVFLWKSTGYHCISSY